MTRKLKWHYLILVKAVNPVGRGRPTHAVFPPPLSHPGRTSGLQCVLPETSSPPGPCQACHPVLGASFPLSGSMKAPLSLQTAWHPMANLLSRLSSQGRAQCSLLWPKGGYAQANCPVLATARALLAMGGWHPPLKLFLLCKWSGFHAGLEDLGTTGICLGSSPGLITSAGCSAGQAWSTVGR